MFERYEVFQTRQQGGRLATVSLACLVVLSWMLGGCSLTNIGVDECSSDSECRDAFGYGSRCVDGYCSAPTSCTTGHDCRRAHGGGACLEGLCVDRLPTDPLGACALTEPIDLPGDKLIGEGAPIIVGGMFLPDVDFSPPISDAVKLAIREINGIGGLELGRELGMVLCDNGGTMNGLEGDERQARIEGVVDHLAGTLGVPFIVGPLTSSDSLSTVQYMLSKAYPTLLVSPSATSPGLTNEPDQLSPDDDYGLFWRTVPRDELQGKVLAQNVARVYPTADRTINEVAVAYRDDAYGLGLANAFQVEFTGNTLLQKFDVDADLSSVASAAAASTPDAVLFIDIGGDRATGFIAAMASETSIMSAPLYLADGSKTDTLLDEGLAGSTKTIIFNQAAGTVAAPPDPSGPAFNLFSSSYQSEFDVEPANFAFTANGYDAVFVGAAAVVWASQNGNNDYDGRNVAEGLSRLVGGTPIAVGSLTWPDVKNGLTSGDRLIDIIGVSGPLDFDVSTGQAPAAIEIWQPSEDDVACGAQSATAPCLLRLETVVP